MSTTAATDPRSEANVKTIRHMASTVVFIIAIAGFAAGWGLAFTRVGAGMITFGLGATFLAAALRPSLPRLVIAAHLIGFHLLWLPGLAGAFLVPVAVIITRRVRHQRPIPPSTLA